MDAQGEWAREPNLATLRSAHGHLRDDPRQALAEFGALANSGSIMSLVYIGDIFEEGLGVERSPLKAEEFYRRAFEQGSAEKNDPRSMYWLAFSFLKDSRNRDQFDKAVQQLERASSLGHLHSTRKLGKILMAGHLGFGKFLYGLRIYVSTAFRAAQLAVDDPTSDDLLDLPLE